ncbi:MAG: calcium/proton exchanger [Planctomycetes bacterium]|nr:calcium/proton exchanger [Planctomycetota bacterium]
MKIGRFEFEALQLLLVFVPVSIILHFAHAPALWIFATAALAIVPLAGLMGKSTEHLSEHVGPAVGGLLNATFGNAAELIIALMALHAGLHDVVKASLTGSIIGNALLVLGLSFLAGGLKFEKQTFRAPAAATSTTLMALAAIGLLIPAVFHAIVGPTAPIQEHELSVAISIVLIITYALGLVFQLVTHKQLYAAGEEHGAADPEAWSVGKSVGVLVAATVGVAIASELLVGSVEETAKHMGMTQVFIGVIVVAIIGNAAEHSTAVLMAMKNKMDLSIGVAVGSSIQIALFVAPVLVFASYAFGTPLDLVFTPFEVVAVIMTVGVMALVAMDGESNWLEGVMLLAVYLMLGIAFYFLPAHPAGGHP